MWSASTVMLLAGGGTALIGVWTTAETTRAQVGQGLVAVILIACGVVLLLIRRAPRRMIEAIAVAAIVLIGALVAVSEPLGMAPTFFLWPVVLLAYFSSGDVALRGYLVMVAALATALAINDGVPLRVDTFVGTVASVGLMAWLVAAMTRRQARTSEDLARAAETDPLTGLLNRRALHPRLEQLSAESSATGCALSVVAFDLDHFKWINDEFGHLAGDRVLQHVAAALAGACRAGDLVGRLGGEEFVAVLPGAGPDQAAQFADRAAQAMRVVPELDLTVSISAGSAPSGRARRTRTPCCVARTRLCTRPRRPVAGVGPPGTAPR